MEKVSIFDKKFTALVEGGLSFLRIENNAITFVDDKSKLSVEQNAQVANSLNCSFCQVKFEDQAQQRLHYKLDWHRYNLKQHLLNRTVISEDQFNEKSDDISSISGSDTDTEEDSLDTLATAQGKLFLQTQNGRVLSCYRCLLADKKIGIGLSDLKAFGKFDELRCTVLMLGGGHFAGAVFHNGEPILHKTFHCYTVRAGQGGSQSSKDNRNATSQPKSAGASLRRYNETALVQHVKDIVENWKDDIARSDLVIYRASGPYNRGVLFGTKTPLLDRNDPRLRTIPFSSRRATYSEVKRVFELLTTVYVYDTLESAAQTFTKQQQHSPVKPKSALQANRSKSREPTERPLPCPDIMSSEAETSSVHSFGDRLHGSDSDTGSDDDLFTEDLTISFNESLQNFEDSLSPEDRKKKIVKKKPASKNKSKARKLREREEVRKAELVTVISKGDIDTLRKIFSTYDAESEVDYCNELLDSDKNTPLHVAAEAEQTEIVQFLLDSGADVCLKNVKQHTPYVCAQSKVVRELFKSFAKDNPDKFNYNKAQIPVVTSTLTAEEVQERKRQQRKVKRDREKEKRKEKEVKKTEEDEKERFLQLSDREKMALAAERRILNQSGTVIARCFLCAADISGKVPFEYMGNRFCTMDCLKAHRKKAPVKLS